MQPVNWDRYEISLAPSRSPAPAAPPAPRAHAGDRPLAARGDRLVAQLLDALVYLLPVPAAFLIAAGLGGGAGATFLRLLLWATGTVAVWCVQVALLTLRGQTLGKKVLGLRVVDHDGSNPGFVRAVALRQVVPGLLAGVPILGMLFALVDLLCIFGEERRCLHDWLAGTKVVEG
jgi:uncharacterized RDD family membrane protein YckC